MATVTGINRNNKRVPALNYATKRKYSKWTNEEVNTLVKELETSEVDYNNLQKTLGYTKRQIRYKISQIKKNGEYNKVVNTLDGFGMINRVKPAQIIKVKDLIIEIPPLKIKVNGTLEVQNGI